MGRYAARRVVQIIPVLVGLTVVIFFMIHLIPGDPAVIILGNHATPASVAHLRHVLGLDKSIPVQYILFLRNLIQGNLGQSLIYREGVLPLIFSFLPTTLLLTAYTIVLTILFTVPLATVAALRRDRSADQSVRVFLTVALAMPAFWVGIILLLLLSVKVHVFPAGGYGNNLAEHVTHLFLPAFTLSLAITAILVRTLRAGLIENLSADHVRTARAKGLPGRTVFMWHVLRNSALSTVTILGLNIGFLMGGTVIIEQVFALPGIGQLLLNSIYSRDYPVVQGITLIYALIVVVVNLGTDLFYAAIDPRVSLQ